MHEYVQKSIRTTLPRNDSAVSGDELIQAVAPESAESGDSDPAALLAAGTDEGRSHAISRASSDSVRTRERRVSGPRSRPRLTTATPASTRHPRTRRTQTSAPR